MVRNHPDYPPPPNPHRKKIQDLKDKCKAIQMSDQICCECGNRWDANDSRPPKCKPLPNPEFKVSDNQMTAELGDIKFKAVQTTAGCNGCYFLSADGKKFCLHPNFKENRMRCMQSNGRNKERSIIWAAQIEQEFSETFPGIQITAMNSDGVVTTHSVKLNVVEENPVEAVENFWKESAELSPAGGFMALEGTTAKTTADILEEMAKTFRSRNLVYGDNYQMVGPIMGILFPDGVPVELLSSDQFHLVELIVVKLTRFAVSKLTHIDSIHDAGVYAAMIESILTAGENKNG